MRASPTVSLLFATLAGRSISVAAKGLTGADCRRERNWEGWEDFGGVRRTAWRGDRETEEQRARGEEIGLRRRNEASERRGWVPTTTWKGSMKINECQVIIEISFEWSRKTLKYLQVTGLEVEDQGL
jgi:hypothetical protein